MKEKIQWLAMVIGVGVIVFASTGCTTVDKIVTDYVHEVRVASQKGLDETTLEGKDLVFKQMLITSGCILPHISEPSKPITKENVLDEMAKTGIEAENYEPWQPPLTGIVWIDGILTLATLLGLFKTRNQIGNMVRKGLHWANHIPKNTKKKKS